MPRPFYKPKDLTYRVDRARELDALQEHRSTRELPDARDDRLLLATWNVANFDVQKREEVHFDLIARIVGFFELVALQEINDDLTAVRAIKERLPEHWRLLVSEAGGNDERQAFLFDTRKVALGEKVGKMTVQPSKLEAAGGPGFPGFDRNPYLSTFTAGELTLLLANVHSIYGSAKATDMKRRVAETKAVAWWCDRRSRDPQAYTRNIFALGDFNLPKAVEGDPIFDALTGRGLHLPEYQTVIGTTIAKTEKHYDQVAFVPEHTAADLSGREGVFDWDAVLFHDLWLRGDEALYDAYAKYAISDHRPLWVELKI